MKKLSLLKFAVLLGAFSLLIVQCKKDDVVTQKDATFTSGSDSLSTYSKDSQDSIWDLESHSRLMSEFKYEGEGITFNAEFNIWDCEIKFNEAKPEDTKIEAVVYTRSIQTGAPAGTEILKKVDGTDSISVATSGRDGEIFACSAYYIKASDEPGIVGRQYKNDYFLNGCLTKPKGSGTTASPYTASTMGITIAETATSSQKDKWGRFLPSAITNESDKGTFKSTSCEKLGDGYLAKGTFTWRGISEDVELRFKYLGEGVETKIRTVEGEFDFSALDKGFISDVHVQGDVKVKIHLMLTKKKA